ncbi:unnamed protein product [Rhizoctonia solani]|uniref:Anaphase-promoting complex subunit 11 n=1 Tax=Rhizoctonia solani TaxID=456999 RepID=A0A8H3DJR1_9AGAM|nr:unnamed protein product [Rhizoctonia solani]
MKVKVKHWHAVAHWKWDVGTEVETQGDDEEEEDVCGICRVAFEGCCPACKTPGDDCPLSECSFKIAMLPCHSVRFLSYLTINWLVWGQCTHVFHMHCLIKWIEQPASKQQCPMDRRPWVTAEGKVDRTQPSGTAEVTTA